MIFEYLDFRRFLSDWFEARKIADPEFSHRSFARLAGHRSPSLLLEIIKGRRKLNPQRTEKFARAMGLRADEADFFARLVRLGQARTPQERNECWQEVAATRRFRDARRIEGEAFRYISHWYYPAIRELARCPGFRPDPEWVAETLHPPITPHQAGQALEALQDLGLLVVEEDGAVRVEDADVVTASEVAGLAALNYHLGMLERATEAVERMDAAERHFMGITVAISSEQVPALKRAVNRVTEQLLELCESHDGPRDRVVQINLNFLPLATMPVDDVGD